MVHFDGPDLSLHLTIPSFLYILTHSSLAIVWREDDSGFLLGDLVIISSNLMI